MSFLTLESLPALDKATYKKTIAKDKKRISKAKGVLVMDDYKFSNGKEIAVVFTKKAKEAKEKFKTAKEKGHPTAKMARGTCELVKEADGSLSLKMNFLEGGLAPAAVQTASAGIFQALGVTPKITNIPMPEPVESDVEEPDDEEDEREETPVQEQQPKKSASVQGEKSTHQQLVEQARLIGDFVKTALAPLAEKVKTRQPVSLAEYEQLNEQTQLIRAWVGVFNGADSKVKTAIGAGNAAAIKESYVKVSQVRMAAFKLCPEAQAQLQQQQQQNNNEQTPQNQQTDSNNQQTPQNEQQTPKEQDANNNEPVSDNSQPPQEQQVTANNNAAPQKNITGSVGSGGFNRKEDVMTVQELLNKAGYSLTVDGGCGTKTVTAIMDFQRNKLGTTRPDGRIDPGGKTWQALVKGAAPTPQPNPQTPAGTGISASVGYGGKNSKADVLIIQQLLQKAGYTLAVDGVCGKGTIGIIRDFQQNKMKNKTVNGIVNPNGETWKALQAGKVDDVIDLRDKDAGKYDYTRIASDLFVKGNADDHEIDETDVQQGQIGDCYFMSAIAAVAKTNPEAIKKLIKAKSDGSYDVTLYAKGNKLALEPTIVNVKPDFVTDKNGNLIYAGQGDKELWVMLLEKAYAKLNGGYDDVGEGGFIEAGLEALTGQDKQVYMMYKYSEDEISKFVQDAIAAKKPITAASEGSGEKEFTTEAGNVIYQGHAYSIESLTSGKLFLRNPWGYDHATLTLKEFKKYFNHFVI